MKTLLLMGAAFGLGMLTWAMLTPTPTDEIMRMIEEEAARQGRTIDKESLRMELGRFTSEQLVILREYVKNIIARSPKAVEWLNKLRETTEINKKFWKDYQGIIFGT